MQDYQFTGKLNEDPLNRVLGLNQTPNNSNTSKAAAIQQFRAYNPNFEEHENRDRLAQTMLLLLPSKKVIYHKSPEKE